MCIRDRLANPRHKQWKTYWVQVEGDATNQACRALEQGVLLKDGPTLPARCRLLQIPTIWDRNPPIRYRASVPDSWIELSICEGRNRQVRRMTAAVGLPTLRLIRKSIGPYSVDGLEPGQHTYVEPITTKTGNDSSKRPPNSFSKRARTRSTRHSEPRQKTHDD